MQSCFLDLCTWEGISETTVVLEENSAFPQRTDLEPNGPFEYFQSIEGQKRQEG